MGFSCGIVGLPNAGKSTLFCALSGSAAEVAPYPFTTLDKNVGMAPVKDARLLEVAKIARSRKTTPAMVQFRDIAGLVKGASKGEGLGNQFLAHVRETDAIVHVIRCFDEPDVAHVYGSVDPRREAEIVNTEMLLSDLAMVERRLAKALSARKAHTREAEVEASSLEWLKELLSSGVMPRRALSQYRRTPGSPAISDRASTDKVTGHGKSADKSAIARAGVISGDISEIQGIRGVGSVPDEIAKRAFSLAAEMGLLTAKPTFYLANVPEEYAGDPTFAPGASVVRDIAEEEGAPFIGISAKIEAEIQDLPPSDREAFRRDMGLAPSLLDTVVSLGYGLLDLITFFTANENEARAWALKDGSTVYEAAGKIHSDMQRGFVKADVINSEDLIRAGSVAKARDQGLMRLEGKEYVVQDGDVIYIRFA